ncbi:hypothetical protein, partial [Novosphingobium naphthalenivorans]|uniref:hypothetical protein n=1 Tax=Novosphingobium naphthalenivorans TaxID=273168 RepID=UPI0012EE9E78
MDDDRNEPDDFAAEADAVLLEIFRTQKSFSRNTDKLGRSLFECAERLASAARNGDYEALKNLRKLRKAARILAGMIDWNTDFFLETGGFEDVEAYFSFPGIIRKMITKRF